MDGAHRLHVPWPPRRSHSRHGLGSIWLRLRVWLHHWRLDHEIASGGAPTSPLLRMRAAALIEPRRRKRLAVHFDRLVDEVAKLPPRMSAAAPLNRPAIEEAGPLLLGLARDLRDPGPVSPQGVARAVLLLTDGGGPLYGTQPPLFAVDEPSEALSVAVRSASAALFLGPQGER
jgi:hypothetical protein